MNDSVEHCAPERLDPVLMVAACDRAMTMAGLPTYSDLAERLAALERSPLGTAIAETRRLRTAHGIVAKEIAKATAAFVVSDAATGMDLLDKAEEFSAQHALIETAQPQPENVVLLAAHRVQRVAADLGRL